MSTLCWIYDSVVLRSRFSAVACVCLLMSIVGCSSKASALEEVEALLGIPMPENATDVHYLKQPHSPEFDKPYDAYVRASMSEADYLQWIDALKLVTKQAADVFILGTGSLKSVDHTPDWWQPEPVISELTADGAYGRAEAGTSNRMIATYQKGVAYLKVYESATP